MELWIGIISPYTLEDWSTLTAASSMVLKFTKSWKSTTEASSQLSGPRVEHMVGCQILLQVDNKQTAGKKKN